MTTIQQFLERQLVEHGLWPDEATQVVSTMRGKLATVPEDGEYDQIKDLLIDTKDAHEQFKAVKFDDSTDAYPKSFLAVLLMIAKKRGVDWIDANKPMHFARPLLNGDL